MKTLHLFFGICTILSGLSVTLVSESIAEESSTITDLKKILLDFSKNTEMSFSYKYEAMALDDCLLYNKRSEKLKKAFYGHGVLDVFLNPELKKGDLIESVAVESVFGGDKLLYKFTPTGGGIWKHSLECFFDGNAYIVKTDPGKYISVQPDMELPLSPYHELLLRVPLYLSTTPAAVIKKESPSWDEFVAQLSASQEARLNVSKDGHSFNISCRMNLRPGVDGDDICDEISIEGKLQPNAEINKLTVTPVRLNKGRTVYKYGSNVIEYSEYKKYGEANIPTSIIMRKTSTFSDFGGKSTAEIAKTLGVSEDEVQSRNYSVIEYRYHLMEASPKDVSKIGIKIQKGDPIYNRFTDDYGKMDEGAFVTTSSQVLP